MAVRQQDLRAFDVKPRQVGIAIEAVEIALDAGQRNVLAVAFDDHYFADFRAKADAPGVINKGRALVIAGAIVENPVKMVGQMGDHPEEIVEVVGNFLDRDEFEPAQDRGDDLEVFGAALVRPEIGNIPGRDAGSGCRSRPGGRNCVPGWAWSVNALLDPPVNDHDGEAPVSVRVTLLRSLNRLSRHVNWKRTGIV
jgi:hypothetical protein